MSGNDPRQDLIQWAEAQRWLAKADEDVAAARMLLAALPGQAGFHIQQAVEKTLKAMLVAKSQDIRKTHDIALLAGLARPHWPALVPRPFGLARLTEWYLSSRYPELDETDPDAADVASSLAEVDALMLRVRDAAPLAGDDHAREGGGLGGSAPSPCAPGSRDPSTKGA